MTDSTSNGSDSNEEITGSDLVTKTLLLLLSRHDKLTHFVAFFVETLLFTICIAERRLYFDKSALGVFPSALPRTPTDDMENGNVGSDGDVRKREEAGNPPGISKYTLAFVVCLIGGAVGSEFLQYLVTHGRRSFDPLDILCNVCGGLLGLVVAYCVDTTLQRRSF